MEPSINKNSVQNLIRNPFSTLTHKEQMEIKQLGRPTPDLKVLVLKSKIDNKKYTYNFHEDTYKKYPWLCGCEVEKTLFCFPCLCFGNDANLWTKCGIKQLDDLSTKIIKHQNSFDHIQNEINLKILDNRDVNDKIDKLNEIEIKRYNEKIKKNRYVLEIYLKCVLSSETYILPLKNQYNNIMTSGNKNSVFLGAIELCKSSDENILCYLENSTSIDWTSKSIHDDLLDCIFLVARQNILSEIEKVEFISIIVDGTIDVSNTIHFVLLFRYELNGKPVERFWGFFNANNEYNEESLTHIILSEVNSVVKNAPYKLVAQSYGGADVISKVNVEVKKLYPYAYYMHCHSHHLDEEMIQSVSMHQEVQIFFSHLSGITEFFSKSPQRINILHGLINNYRPSQSKCDFTETNDTLKTVYLYRNEIINCMDIVIDTLQQTPIINQVEVNQAVSIKSVLRDSLFICLLSVFEKIMPNVQSLHNSVRNPEINNSVDVHVPTLVKQFAKKISDIRDYNVADIVENISNLQNMNVKTKRLDERFNNLNYNKESYKKLGIDICDTLIKTTKDRLTCINHLIAVKLFQAEKYPSYSKHFPYQLFQFTLRCYPFFDKDKLKTELQIIYHRDDFRNLSGIIPTYQYILKFNMNDIFKEAILLLKILITVPPITTKNKNSYSKLKMIKTCLENTMFEEKLNALLIIKIEKEMISNDTNFSKKVINMFSEKNKYLDFKYKTK